MGSFSVTTQPFRFPKPRTKSLSRCDVSSTQVKTGRVFLTSALHDLNWEKSSSSLGSTRGNDLTQRDVTRVGVCLQVTHVVTELGFA